MDCKTLDVTTANEGGLYAIIHELGGSIWFVEHSLADGRMKESPETSAWLQDARKLQRSAVARLDEFGVSTNDGEPTKEYRRWYSWWRDWDKSQSGDVLNDAIRECDLSNNWVLPDELRPAGSW